MHQKLKTGQYTQKPINRHRALGGGWGGGGPNPSLSLKCRTPYINPRHSKQRFEPLVKVALNTIDTKNHLKKCKLEVRRVFCTNYESTSKVENRRL